MWHRVASSLLAIASIMVASPGGAAVGVSTFYGFDQHPDGNVPPRLTPGNAASARNSFLGALGGSGSPFVQDFEALAAGSQPDALTIGPVNAQLERLASPSGSYATPPVSVFEGTHPSYFTYPVSGARFLDAVTRSGTSFYRMTFSTPLRALGFYHTDASDWFGNGAGTLPPLKVELATSSGGTIQLDLTEGVDPLQTRNGGLGFFGVVLANDVITKFTLLHPNHPFGGEDAIGLDDLTVSPVPEPATWITMLAALGILAGWRMRSRGATPG
jgi:hypothetical protein